MTEEILLIGGGGREHALAWKLAQSSSIKHIYVSPGNAGTHGIDNVSNIELNIKDHEAVIRYCKSKSINVVVVGPESPLEDGLADSLKHADIKCFGPSKSAARIEASKEFSKSFMDRHGIPTARWKSFKNDEAAKNHILSASYEALVVKPNGFAAGIGVVVASSRQDAVEAIDFLKHDKILASASENIVVEELLEGEEVSVLCFTDGNTISVMPPAQDHKRLLDGDQGPNTAGMGAYCRCPQLSAETLQMIEKDVLQKAVDGMKSEGSPYVGVLFAGLMLTKDGPKVLEFNCRFGDPETQVILPLLKTDLYEIILGCIDGKLANLNIEWMKDQYAVGVVIVSDGYPASYSKGKVIKGLDTLVKENLIIFHAGSILQAGEIVTSDGRVLSVVAIGRDLLTASQKAQLGAKRVQFEGAFFRKDIALKAICRLQGGGMTYKSYGVDIERANNLVNAYKAMGDSSVRPGVVGSIGGFGFDLKVAGYVDPFLVAGTDDVGTKLMAELYAGAIIKQGAVHVDIKDTVATLQEKVKCQEDQIFPKALELLASEKISRTADAKLVWHV